MDPPRLGPLGQESVSQFLHLDTTRSPQGYSALAPTPTVLPLQVTWRVLLVALLGWSPSLPPLGFSPLEIAQTFKHKLRTSDAYD